MGKKFSEDTDSDWLNYHDNDKGLKFAKRCHESHPVMKIGGGTLFAGSCINPRPDYDAYVGLDGSMHLEATGYPWAKNRIEHVHFPITDMKAPPEPELFKELVEWICNQLQEGKKIHVGCIGGHGRSGTLVAAVAAKFGHKDAIAWARQHHCKKAVESQDQVNFLVKHYGVTQAPPAKGWHSNSKPAPQTSFSGGGASYTPSVGSDGKQKRLFSPAPSKKSIWAN